MATAAAVALTVAGARQRDGHAVLVGCAFSIMAALLCLHGLATPGIVVGMNGVVAFTGGATLPVGGAILALGVLPALRRPSDVVPLLWLLALGALLILGLGLAAIAEPGLVPPVPKPRSPVAWLVLVTGMAFYALLFWRALHSFRLTQKGSASSSWASSGSASLSRLLFSSTSASSDGGSDTVSRSGGSRSSAFP